MSETSRDERIVIREATPDDAPTVLRLIRELAAYEREPDAVQVTEEALREQLAADPAPFECLLGEVDGEPAGFVLFFQTYSSWKGRPGVWLEDLYVCPSLRGRGVARALVERVVQMARARGYGRLELNLLDWNHPAHAFYRRLGAEALEEWTVWRLDLDKG